jgi:glycosyltransferase involved in cell wall biosynthesis
MFLQAYVCRLLFCPNTKLVCTVKKNTYRQYPGLIGWLKNAWARFGLRHTDHIIAVSEKVIRLFREDLKVPAHRISKCRQLGVDTSFFKPAGERNAAQTAVIGYCGRLDRDKGVMDLIDAVGSIRERAKFAVRLELMGSGTLAKGLETLSRQTDWMRILPAISNAEVAAFLQKLDVFVLPSHVLPDHQEHDAHALMEAMSVGLATVGTRTGIIPEMLGDGAGVLVDPEEPHELAAALLELVNDPESRQRLGQRGREKAEREFALDVVARRKAKIFKELV